MSAAGHNAGTSKQSRPSKAGKAEAPVRVNRAPVMALWAAVVAERLGHDPDEALTLGRVPRHEPKVAGISPSPGTPGEGRGEGHGKMLKSEC